MVNVKLFGSARIKLHEKEINIEAKSIKEMINVISERYQIPKKEMKQFLIFVNEVNIHKLKMYHTSLNDGDTIMLLSPASGG